MWDYVVAELQVQHMGDWGRKLWVWDQWQNKTMSENFYFKDTIKKRMSLHELRES